MTKRTTWMTVLMIAMLFGLVGCAGEAPVEEAEAPAPAPAPVEEVEPAPEPMTAVATLAAVEGGTVEGEVRFVETEDGVTITAAVGGAEPGSHGFHLHETGDCSAADFTSAGGHFNPYETPHAGPSDAERHAGDLGNIMVDENGEATMEMTSDLVTVGEGPASVVGRAVVMHAGEDDLTSQPSGAAGARVACGVIALEGAVDEGTMAGDEGADEG